MLGGLYETLYNRLRTVVPDHRLIHDELRTLAFGTDASFYRLIPKLVVRVENETEVVHVLASARNLRLPLTFRAAGTSLSGQAISDSVLVMLGPSWSNYGVGEKASTITLQPGVVGANANRILAPYGKKIGPDPASINAAMIGGIAANNASGMCCGTAQNSYRTLESMRIVLCDGTILDTRDPHSTADFVARRKDLVAGVVALRDRIAANTGLAERIRRKFKMKNTTGYSLNAFVDFTDPVDIIQHLMIGSEGTLGFISEVTYRTVPELADKASCLMLFPDITTACTAVDVLKRCRVEAVELMDRASLRSVENKPGMPDHLKTLDARTAALLVETRAEDPGRLHRQIEEITTALAPLPKVMPLNFTTVASEYAQLWNIRKGLFPSLGSMRATGTTCIIEDVAFPVPRLAEATTELQGLFRKHSYEDAIIFGHALEGNLHFVFNQDFNDPAEVQRYARFMDDVTQMVVHTYDGSLKAEHGTGRNMAPFVELEWGEEAYELMKDIKNLFDPQNILNPDVIINMDRAAHLKNLKPLPAAHSLIDKCIECGFCEVHCPSKDLTLTPRQRIVVYREICRLNQIGQDRVLSASLKGKYDYFGNQTCATDGLCALACPVNIDTGKFTKELRFQGNSKLAGDLAGFIADHFAGTTSLIRGGLNAVDVAHVLLTSSLMERISRGARRLTGDRLPLWNKHMPKGAPRVHAASAGTSGGGPKVVYFPSCINRTFGVSRDQGKEEPVHVVTARLLRKAGFQVVYPRDLDRLCCGMAFDSKGFKEQGTRKARELESALLEVSGNGEHPVYVDMSPCLYRMKEILDKRLNLFEPVEFALRFLVSRMEMEKISDAVAVHSTCSSIKMGLTDGLIRLAGLCAERVVVPDGVECCGWAGDRGFTYPELNESALSTLRNSIPTQCKQGYSTSRTCEIGLSLHSGIPYRSIVYLLDKCMRERRRTETSA